jgi:flagellar biosynthesis/type III secretory pathway protein FliH
MYLGNIYEMSDWCFPELEVGGAAVDGQNQGEGGKEDENRAVSDGETLQAGQANEADLVEDPNQTKINELESLKQEYEAKIAILDNLLSKLKNPTSILDEELIELIQDIIKKITKNIICREIEKDNLLLPQMINELKALIDNKNGILNIYMSQLDLVRLDSEKNNLSGLASVDDRLGTGDIIIKSNFAEVRAVLNERIEQLMRIEHE